MTYSHEAEHHTRSRISLFFALSGVIMLPLGALGTKFGLWSHHIGMIMMVLGFLAALVPVALFLGFGWHAGYRSERPALLWGFILGLLPLFVAISLYTDSGEAPIIHDISTDTTRPPEYQAVLQLRDSGDNALDWQSAEAETQREAYPDLAPIQTSLSLQQARTRALQVAADLGWEIVDSDSRPGYIEAVDTTFWFGFKDDIVIRIEASANGSSIDLRSASRVGSGDMGANAKRIRAFITTFNQQ